MVEEKPSPAYVRVHRGYALLVAVELLLAVEVVVVAIHTAQPITSQVKRIEIITGGTVIAIGLALVAVRTGRLGVYAQVEGLQIRGIFRAIWP